MSDDTKVRTPKQLHQDAYRNASNELKELHAEEYQKLLRKHRDALGIKGRATPEERAEAELTKLAKKYPHLVRAAIAEVDAAAAPRQSDEVPLRTNEFA